LTAGETDTRLRGGAKALQLPAFIRRNSSL
jgi:hypothetical protein